MISRTTLQVQSWMGQYVQPHGLFFMYNPRTKKAGQSATCRDIFRWYWEYPDTYAGSSNTGPFNDPISPYVGIAVGQEWDIEAFGATWRTMERTLGIKRHTQVHKTNARGTIILRLCPFWLANDTRRSLVTLFIRAFVISPTKPLDEALNAYSLGRRVKKAVSHFMSGHVNPTYDQLTHRGAGYVGFVSFFSGRTQAQIERLLIKPPNKRS